LEKPTPQKIEQLIEELIEERIADGQLDECDLTLGEIKLIKDRFKFTLMTMLHTRIAYPKQESKFALPQDESLRADVMAERRKPASAPPVSAA
jgi:membrane-associated HD superfamily phosphohydrolase